MALLALLSHAVTVPAGESAPPGMAPIPAGTYTPLFKNEGAVEVRPFFLDVHPVTNGEFLEFVQHNPQWRKSKIKRLFADESYLANWRGDLEPGPDAPSDSPVVRVSWHAARAYSQWKGRRLPVLAEWEYVAAASENSVQGEDDPSFQQRILEWYGRPVRGTLPAVGSTFTNIWGVCDMHGLVWEWVSDFNTALVTGESRGDTGLERNLFCGSGALGASTFKDYAAFMRYAFRSSLKADYTVQNLGFRCAKDGETP